MLRDLTSTTINGETVLTACTNVCTPIAEYRLDEEAIVLTSDDDPQGAVATFAKRRSAVITRDNLVGVYYAHKKPT